MPRGFDFLAPFYDFLSELVFGKELTKSQLHFLQQAPEQSHILVVGGGTGAILQELKLQPGCELDFLELSSGMMKKARARATSAEVRYLELDFFTYSTDKRYDLLLFPFFLDMFTGERLIQASEKVKHLLKKNGKLVVTEFLPPENLWGWKSLMVKVMYIFFNLCCGIEARKLPDWKSAFCRDWQIKSGANFFHSMVGAFSLEARLP